MARKRAPKKKPQGPPQGQQPGQQPAFRLRRGPLDTWLGAGGPQSTSGSPFPGALYRGHTLADEARNTNHNRSGFMGLDSKLRYKPVTFVSAGFMEPLKELEVQQTKTDTYDPARVASHDETQEVFAPKAVAYREAASQHVEVDNGTETTESDAFNVPASDLFTVDTSGDKSLRSTKQQHAVIPVCHESDHDTDSSEEVILFKGRDALRQAGEPRSATPIASRDKNNSIQLREMDVEIKFVEKTITADTTRAAVVEKSTLLEIHQASPKDKTAIYVSSSHTNDPSPYHALLDNTQSDEEAAIIADYIANIDNDDEEEEGEEDEDSDAKPGLGSHAFHMLRDLGGTDSDAVPEIQSENELGENKSDDKATIGESADAQRRRMELEDERMARILAKQEELGLGSDDVVLSDDADTEDGQGDWKIAPKLPPRRTKKGASKNAKIIQKKGQYPSATEMASAFDDLDLMDWHRAALDNFNQATKRSSRIPHVSDSELEEALNASFQKDRLKKAEKKRQREALRAHGLLGKKVNPDDLRIKYPAGMSPADLEYELEQFLAGTDQQLALPPLDKQARKIVHLVASRLKLKSASAGSGNSRHPVLYRTDRTISTDHDFDSAMNRLSKQTFFARADVDAEFVRQHTRLNGINTSRKRDHGRSNNAVSYREGEVVGQHASELGSENKGRLLLEKMGWSKGMALGTVDNKGIMVPIAHTMKKGKAGLGET